MPDQNPADPTAPGPVSSFGNLGAAAEPPPSTAMDSSELPPAPPIVEPALPETPPVGDIGGAAPTFDISGSMSGTPPPKKKFGGRKFVATILGLLVLVGGLGAGIILVQQQQDIRERAAGPVQTYCSAANQANCPNGCTPSASGGICKSYCSSANNKDCIYGCTPNNSGGTCKSAPTPIPTTTVKPTTTAAPTTTPKSCTTSDGKSGTCMAAGSCTGQVYSDSSSTLNCKTTPLGGGGGAICCVPKAPTPTPYCSSANNKDCIYGCTPNNSGGTCKSAPPSIPDEQPGERCAGLGGKCVEPEVAASPNRPEFYCDKLGQQSCPANEVCIKCAGASTPVPTLTPPPGGGVVAQCLNIRAFDTNWVELTVAQLAQLKAGDKVRFTVGGTASGGSFDKAKFKINGVERPEVTGKRPDSQEYFDEYTLPEGVTTFTINAQIHHSSLGWSN